MIFATFLFLQCSVLCRTQFFEEFVVRGPGDLQATAINEYVAERRKNPENKDMGDDSPLMQRAKNHAIKRFSATADEDLKIIKRDFTKEGEGSTLLQLPAPEDQGSYLAAAVTAKGSSNGLVSVEEINALAVSLNEDIGFGAISKSGALPMGDSLEWVKFAEDKLKRDARIDHQSLLWELGSEVVEMEQASAGGLNVSLEEELIANLTAWFTKGGGSLKYVEPSITKENGLRLVASEGIGDGEVAINVPIKLTMSRISARNVLLKNKGKYLGEELKKTFEKNEVWALSIFLLHEWYKETAGSGSNWGPFLRTLRMRSLSTPVVQSLRNTRAMELSKQWFKSSSDLRFYSSGAEGPCSPTTAICNTKPDDKFGGSRFELHHMRWAYWVVKQNAVRVHHASTGQSFLALVPFYNLVDKRLGSGGGVVFDMDGSVKVVVGSSHEEGEALGVHPGNFTDSEYFMRFLSVPKIQNPYNHLEMVLPGALPEGSDYHICLKDADSVQGRKKCKSGDKGNDLMWKMKTLSEWRKAMNLPPRLGDLRMWATRLHLYGDDEEEQKKISATNQVIAGLPVSTDQISAEDQLMLLGIAESNSQAMALVQGNKEKPPPQLYSAPDPEEDPEAQKAMENLASLALQVHRVVGSGNIILNATRAVLNQTKEFFQHGVMPKAGLDELDDFILKKIGMLAHCGVDKAMKISHGNISKELMCAMRVHLLNESEMNVFCPAEAKVFHENCQNVEFMNYTAISLTNELNVIEAFRNTLNNLLESYPNDVSVDREVFADEETSDNYGPVYLSAIRLRIREKELLISALDFLKEHETLSIAGNITFQLDLKMKEREEADKREAEHKLFVEEIKRRASVRLPLAVVPVDMGADQAALNLTLVEGADIKDTVLQFCRQHNIGANYVDTLQNALRQRVVSPRPLFLLLGVVGPTGEYNVLGVEEGANATIETGVFCARTGIKDEECDKLQERVQSRINAKGYVRRILAQMNVDAPDGRKLVMVIREGEQHELAQFTSDFLSYYKMYSQQSVNILANEIYKRLSPSVLQIPVGLNGQRQVTIRFADNDNITAVVEAFTEFYELRDENVKIQITRRARHGMAPGSFLI